jgi:predicted sulfurtransferase
MTAVSRYVWFYRYAPKPLEATALASTQKLLLQNWRPAGVLGRLFLAPEGVNAQLAVPQGYLPALTEQLQRDLPFLLHKDVREGPTLGDEGREAFDRLDVLIKKRLVADGLSEEDNARLRPLLPGANEVQTDGSTDCPGPSAPPVAELSPRAWHDSLALSSNLVIDCRNDFESEVGRFTGARGEAVRLGVDRFQDAFAALDRVLDASPEHAADNAAPVSIYCTGGIRCVKLGAHLRAKGRTDVRSLQGGINAYAAWTARTPSDRTPSDRTPSDGSQPGSRFLGRNVSFDKRITARLDCAPKAARSAAGVAACSGRAATPAASDGRAGDPSDRAAVGALPTSRNLGGDRLTGHVLSRCHQCGAACDALTNCSNRRCGTLFLQCSACAALYGGRCSPECGTSAETLRAEGSPPARLRPGSPMLRPGPAAASPGDRPRSLGAQHARLCSGGPGPCAPGVSGPRVPGRAGAGAAGAGAEPNLPQLSRSLYRYALRSARRLPDPAMQTWYENHAHENFGAFWTETDPARRADLVLRGYASVDWVLQKYGLAVLPGSKPAALSMIGDVASGLQRGLDAREGDECEEWTPPSQ